MPSFLAWFDLAKASNFAAFCISLISIYFTWQSRRLAGQQERRRDPRLLPSLIKAHLQNNRNVGGRTYSFHVIVTNPTDSNNAITEADLAITYLMAKGTQMTVKFRANEPPALDLVKSQDTILVVPVSISAHSAVSGWLSFHVPANILADVNITSYRLIFTDPQLREASVAPILIQEVQDET